MFEVGNTAGVKHGMSRTPEYQCWVDIKSRCLNPEHRFYPYYGGRGITICDRWKDDFKAFFEDVGPRPSPRHTIDRHPNNDGNYEPGNVRWATRKEQVDNRRTSRFVMVDGVKRPLSDVIRERGLDRRLILSRVERGWEPERAISTPAAWHRKKKS